MLRCKEYYSLKEGSIIATRAPADVLICWFVEMQRLRSYSEEGGIILARKGTIWRPDLITEVE